MLCTNYYGCCRLFQTTIKNYKVPHFRSTDLSRIQVTIRSLAATYAYKLKQRYCTMLATATGNCDVTNVNYNANKYMSSRELSVLCRHVNCLSRVLDVPARTPVTMSDRCYVPLLLVGSRSGVALKFDQFYHSSFF